MNQNYKHMKTMRKNFWIYSLAAICVGLVLTLGCERERLFEPELSSNGMFEGVDLQINPLSIPDGERYLIGFHKTPDISVIKGVGGEVYRTFTIVPAVAARLSPQAAAALEKNPRVRYVEPDHEVFAHGQTVPWGINRVFGNEANRLSTWEKFTGAGIGVAILDTGIDKDHVDLTVAGGITTVDNTDWHSDGNGHGTHVAGTVAALDNNLGVVGVAPAVDLYAVKVLSDGGSGTVSSVAGGIDWAVKQGIPVLNMSLGSSTSSQTLKDACDAAYKAGHLLVASAGNSGNPGGRGDNVGYPAAYESVIAVAASTSNDRRASYSSTGPAVELIAPGSSILSTLPGNNYGTYSGTSMASPHVAGVAALVKSANPDLTNVQIRTILQETAEDLGLSSNQQGYGLARADLAVREVGEVEPPATGNIEGTVKDEDGTAIGGATVVVEGTGLLATTGEDGDYILENVPAGDQKVTASADNYYSKTEIVTVEKDAAVTQDFTLEAIPTYTVSGTVKNVEGYALEGATVTIEGTDQSATTNGDGNYSIPGVEEGTYSITASKSGYSSQTQNVTVKSDTPVDFTLNEETGTELSIDTFELTNTSNPAWARVTVNWAVSGSNLFSVKSEMIRNGSVVDSQTSSVSGSNASGTHELRHRGGTGTYSITLTVTDENETISDTKSIDL